jgi:DNA-binding response OmpR family regulator
MAEHNKPIDFTSIMIVDNNLLLLRQMAFLLKVAGFEVTSASDAAGALDLLRGRVPDLIIAEADMPGFSGCELLCQLRAHSSWRSIPVILTSSQYALDDLMRALDLGANDYLPKPFDVYDLLDSIKQVLVPRPFDVVYRQVAG